MKFSHVALLGASTLVAAHPRAHHIAHHHLARHNGSPVVARDGAVAVVTQTAPGPVETVYQLNGVDVAALDVAKGLADGRYVVVGGPPTSATPTPTPTPSPSPSPSPSSTKEAAIFVEKKPTSSAVPTPTPEPTTSSTVAIVIAPSSSSPAAAAPSDSSSNSGDVSLEFPSGKVACSSFPSKYGAVYNDYLKLGGYLGVQRVPGYSLGAKSISYIETAIAGEICTKNSYCSYQCPAGMQKSQWPAGAQGATGQSIGGLYCNNDGMLELSNTDHKTLCIEGAGGVTVQNKLGDIACVCRTDYPGTESETVSLETQPGKSYPLTSPDALSYYEAATGGHTSAQYYINDSGFAAKDACTWNKPGSNLGNYSPLNLGVGKGTDGVTYVALFYNRPSNPDGVLNFNVRIDGGTLGCKYENGFFYADGVKSDSGCTVGFAAGKEAKIVMYTS